MRSALEKELEMAGCRPGDLQLILLTHGDFDHSGNAAYLRIKYGSKIAMHPADSGVVEHGEIFWNRKKDFCLLGKIISLVLGFGRKEKFVPDLLVEDGADLSGYGFQAKVVYIPGHSSGSIGVLTNTGDLFCGDLIVNPGVPAPTTIIDDPAVARASIQKLLEMNVNTVFPGHGKPFAMDEFVKNYEE